MLTVRKSINGLGAFRLSRRHWSYFFLFAAAISLLLATVVNGYGRALSGLAVLLCLSFGLLARRRMIYPQQLLRPFANWQYDSDAHKRLR